jgi:L-rhamnose mutarotase
MERVCFLLKIKSDRVEEYKEFHETIWPEMLDSLRECGWNNLSVFLREDGLWVGYMETSNLDEAQRALASREVNQRWQKAVAPYFEGLENKRPDDGFLRLEEIFHLD